MVKFYVIIFGALTFRYVAFAGPGDTAVDKVHGNEIIEGKLRGYNKFVRPPGTNASAAGGGPVVVHVNFSLRRLANVDEDNLDYRAELTFRQQWKDVRLAFDAKYITDDRPYLTFRHSEASEKIWTPDTFFQNAIDVREYELMEPNEMVRIHPDGNVILSKRISLTLAQALDFGNFPFDIHQLALDISSYSHDEAEITYTWRSDHPIQLRKQAIQDSEFRLADVVTKRCVSGPVVGRYSCLRAEFRLQRQASRTQLFEIFGPSFVLVIISWFPFMISTQSILARIILGLSCLITIILQIALISDEFPETHDFTWADVWLITCFAFIVAAQFQLIVHSWLTRIRADQSASRKRAAERRRNEKAAGSSEGHTNEHSAPLLSGGSEREDQAPLFGFETIFDLACLLAFVAAFFIFNCCFWSAVTNISDFDEYGGSQHDGNSSDQSSH